MASVFETLNAINVNEHTEKKSGLTYLSWAWAWSEVKKHYPEATYKVYENSDGWNYFTDGRTCWVKTGVTIEGIENIEYLPVMDYRNKSISLEAVTSFDVNKTIQRSLTKAAARHGLGLYIYAGEDLPEGDASGTKAPESIIPNQASKYEMPPKPAKDPKTDSITDKQIVDITKMITSDQLKALEKQRGPIAEMTKFDGDKLIAQLKARQLKLKEAKNA